MHIKRILAITILVLLCTSVLAFGQTLESPSYTLTTPRIVISGGASLSSNYSLNHVEVGSPFASSMTSPNYSLDTTPLAKNGIIKPPYIVITTPLDGTLVSSDQIQLTGTVDGVPFNETRDLEYGINLVIKEAGYGVYSFSTCVEVYRVREPVELP